MPNMAAFVFVSVPSDSRALPQGRIIRCLIGVPLFTNQAVPQNGQQAVVRNRTNKRRLSASSLSFRAFVCPPSYNTFVPVCSFRLPYPRSLRTPVNERVLQIVASGDGPRGGIDFRQEFGVIVLSVLKLYFSALRDNLSELFNKTKKPAALRSLPASTQAVSVEVLKSPTIPEREKVPVRVVEEETVQAKAVAPLPKPAKDQSPPVSEVSAPAEVSAPPPAKASTFSDAKEKGEDAITAETKAAVKKIVMKQFPQLDAEEVSEMVDERIDTIGEGYSENKPYTRPPGLEEFFPDSTTSSSEKDTSVNGVAEKHEVKADPAPVAELKAEPAPPTPKNSEPPVPTVMGEYTKISGKPKKVVTMMPLISSPPSASQSAVEEVVTETTPVAELVTETSVAVEVPSAKPDVGAEQIVLGVYTKSSVKSKKVVTMMPLISEPISTPPSASQSAVEERVAEPTPVEVAATAVTVEVAEQISDVEVTEEEVAVKKARKPRAKKETGFGAKDAATGTAKASAAPKRRKKPAK